MNSLYSYTKKISLTANQRKDESLFIENDGDFIIERVYTKYDAPFRLNIIDTLSNYSWFSDRIRSDNWFGTPQYPNELTKPIELVRGTIIKIDIENLSAEANDVEIVFEGYKIFDSNIVVSKQKYYCYVMNVEVPSLDILVENIKTNADCDFLINKLYACKDNDYSLDVKLALSNYGGRRLQNEFTNIDNLFGSVLRPNILKHPLKVVKNSIIQLDIKNNLNSIENAQIVFDGIKVW